jgi:phage shock protein A
MKNKDVEDIVLEAIDSMYPTKNGHVDNVIKITKEAFAAHRVQDVTEIQIKNLERCLEGKDKEIWQHKKAIENLRGYMGFLETQIEQYKFRLDEHEISY